MRPREHELLDRLRAICVWKKGEQRAPHKPLLLLLALASIQRQEPRLSEYAELHPRLEELLREFGPPRRSFHPEYPFWRLQNDGGFWEIPERGQAIRRRGKRIRTGDVPPSTLRAVKARGGFTAEVYNLLQRNPELVNKVVAEILEEHFAPSLHEDLLDAVGMPWVVDSSASARRSPAFREELFRIYEHRCAMCGFDGRLAHAHIGLEAAHIRWHAFGGPDEANNGLLLCALHHQALDRGALGLTEDRRVMVSQDVHGGPQVHDVLISLGGSSLRAPVGPEYRPSRRFIKWHQRQVFRPPARPLAA